MPLRTIIGPVVDAGGAGLPSGLLRITPISPAGDGDDGFVVGASEFRIDDGELEASVVVPGRYKFEVIAGAERLISFIAPISDAMLTDISVKELWESRLDEGDLPEDVLREGDDLLALGSGAGIAAAVLQQLAGELLWSVLPDGDMARLLYDPERRGLDPYKRASHVGSQALESIEGIIDAIRSAIPGLVEYAIVSQRHPAGVDGGEFTGGGDRLRPLNTLEVNNSGLADGDLFDPEASTIKLLPGRLYFGWAEAPATRVNEHYLILRSLDGSIDLAGQSSYAHFQYAINNWARLDFTFTIPADAEPKLVRLLHRGLPPDELLSSMGNATKHLFDNHDEEYAKLTILSLEV